MALTAQLARLPACSKWRPMSDGEGHRFLTTDVAAGVGYRSVCPQELPPRYTRELDEHSIRYITSCHTSITGEHTAPSNRLILIPLSWFGITREEIMLLNASQHSLPCAIYTVSMSTACTAFVRIVSREKKGSGLWRSLIGELCCVTGYRYFDMSYEGDYLEMIPDDQPWSEKEVQEMQNAVDDIETWNMKEGEEWISQELIRALTGKIRHGELPSKET